jgi:hypothetical protein
MVFLEINTVSYTQLVIRRQHNRWQRRWCSVYDIQFLQSRRRVWLDPRSICRKQPSRLHCVSQFLSIFSILYLLHWVKVVKRIIMQTRSRPASMISDKSKQQKWTHRLAKHAAKSSKLQKFFSHSPRRRASYRSTIASSEVMEKGRLLLGKQYDGPLNRAARPSSDVVDG